MPALRTALEWIANNDDPTVVDADEVRHNLTVVLVADLWGKEAATLARSIVRLRRKAARDEKARR